MIKRMLTELLEHELLHSERVIALYGPRRTGKTTLVKSLLKKYEKQWRSRYLLCDQLSVQNGLNQQNALQLKEFIGNEVEFLILDEAQNVPEIGLNLKILIDTYPELKIIATGSSSFTLASQVKEPLTGRVWEFFLPPLSWPELELSIGSEIDQKLEDLLLHGFYPQVIQASGDHKRRVLQEIAENYLYQDVLRFDGQLNASFLQRLLQLLAFQIGSEVSLNELATTLAQPKTKVQKYLTLLEQTFVIFPLGSYSRNLRNEMKKKRKYYFWDIGMRNALINNFNEMDLRSDRGGLWENFCIVERLKHYRNSWQFTNPFFWRTHAGQEVDYLEEANGKLHGFEFKWKKETFTKPSDFLKTYPAQVELVHQKNFKPFVRGGNQK